MTALLPTSAGVLASAPFHVMAKPAGPLCNLDCDYCFYLRKAALYPAAKFRMSEEVLEAYIRGYIQAYPGPEAPFAWQGGEPTILGLDFFRRVVTLQKKHANGKKVTNALQTNGTLLDADWGRFLHEHQFLVGLSVDGPRDLHDRHRRDKGRAPTFDRVMRGLEVLRSYRVEFNLLTVISSANARRPREVYRFLRGLGTPFLQFIPLVERAVPDGQDLAHPPEQGPVTPETVAPEAFGSFLCTVFDEWSRRDIGRVYVQAFDVALGQWLGLGSSLCVHSESCGRALAIEHNGDVFACDHYVYKDFRRGNVLETPLAALADSAAQREFGAAKTKTLPALCRECHVRFACQGGCPKHRIAQTPTGEPGLNWLCAGYKQFFTHIDPAMRTMASLVRAGYPAAEYMAMARASQPPTGRNEACPCGSGRKYKRCCGG